MKRILLIFICLLAFTSIFCTFAFASEGVAEEAPLEAPLEATNETFFSRIWEFISKYKIEAITLAGDTGIITLAGYILIKTAKDKKSVNASLSNIKEYVSASSSDMTKIVEVINRLIEAYNTQAEEYEKLKAAYAEFGLGESERNKVVGTLCVEVTTLMEMMSTAYLNNNGVTQGIKDMISAKYAKCLNALKNDEGLAAIVDAAKSALEGK